MEAKITMIKCQCGKEFVPPTGLYFGDPQKCPECNGLGKQVSYGDNPTQGKDEG